MHGDEALALWKTCRTDFSDSPTYLSRSSGPGHFFFPAKSSENNFGRNRDLEKKETLPTGELVFVLVLKLAPIAMCWEIKSCYTD